MKALWHAGTVVFFLCGLTGCARFAIYSDAQLKGPETGIKFYTSKPYLLVAHTGTSDKPIEVSLIHIPDLSNPLYAQARTGLGSANLTLTLNDAGVLTTFGQNTDTKIPELLNAIGGLATSLATARKELRAAPAARSTDDYAKLGARLDSISAELVKQVKSARTAKTMFGPDADTMESIAEVLKNAGSMLRDSIKAPLNAPAVAINLRNALDRWDKLEPTARRPLAGLRDQVQAVLSDLLNNTEPPQFALFEIISSDGTTVLKQVPFR